MIASLLAALGLFGVPAAGVGPGAACTPVPVMEEGTFVRSVCAENPGDGVTIIDLRDDWAPRVFSEAPDKGRRTERRSSRWRTNRSAKARKGGRPAEIRTRASVVADRSPGDAIVKAVSRLGADLVVMSSHGRSGLGRAEPRPETPEDQV